MYINMSQVHNRKYVILIAEQHFVERRNSCVCPFVYARKVEFLKISHYFVVGVPVP